MQRELLRLIQNFLKRELARRKRHKNASWAVIALLTVAVFGISQWLTEPPLAPLPQKGSVLACQVNPSAVYDGDTLTATCPQGRVKVRVWGIDAPEMGQKPWGNQARDLLRDLVPARIRLEVKDRDRYGRTVARVLDGDRDLGLELVRRGAVVVYERYNDSTAYRRAQSEARRRQWGVWAREGSQQNPAAWRRVNARSS